jgi:hypothetical protein
MSHRDNMRNFSRTTRQKENKKLDIPHIVVEHFDLFGHF